MVPEQSWWENRFIIVLLVWRMKRNFQIKESRVCVSKNPSSLNLFITPMLISLFSQISFLKSLLMALLKLERNMTGYFYSDCRWCHLLTTGKKCWIRVRTENVFIFQLPNSMKQNFLMIFTGPILKVTLNYSEQDPESHVVALVLPTMENQGLMEYIWKVNGTRVQRS